MRNDFNLLTVSQLIRKNVATPENITREQQEIKNTIHELKSQLKNLKFAKDTILKKYDFIKSQDEFDKLLDLSVIFPEISNGRQLQVIYYILQFKKAKDIAELCFLTEKAIKWHKTQIYNKLDVFGEKGLLELHKERTSK